MDIVTDQYYTTNAADFVNDTFNLTSRMQPLYDKFFMYLRSNIVLDVGCGSGRDSLYFQNHSLIVTSIDANREMIVSCIDNGVENAINTSIEQFESDLKYGGVWACASLLHLKRCDMMSIFNKIADMMIDGAVLYCSFKYGSFEGYRNGRYFTYMTEGMFEELINKVQHLETVEMFVSEDVRDNVSQKWLNVFLKKK